MRSHGFDERIGGGFIKIYCGHLKFVEQKLPTQDRPNQCNFSKNIL